MLGQLQADHHRGGQRFTGSFLKAAVAFPILGADFLAAFDLIVDLKRGRLVRANRSYVQLSAPPPGCTIASVGVVAAGSSAPSVDFCSPAVDSPAGGRLNPNMQGIGEKYPLQRPVFFSRYFAIFAMKTKLF